MNAAGVDLSFDSSFDFWAAHGVRAPGTRARRSCTGNLRAWLYGSIVTLTQLSVPPNEIAWPANKIVSFSSTRGFAVRTATPRRFEQCATPRADGYLLILILSGAFESYAKRSILFSLFCFYLLFVLPSGRERSIEAAGGTVQMLFSFVASFGRDSGQCVLKQGDSRTILWPQLRRAASRVLHVRAAPAAACRVWLA